MGSPELPDPGEEDLRTNHIVHHPPAASDESDSDESMAYDGYQPLAMDENQTDYGNIARHDNDDADDDDDEGFNSVQTNATPDNDDDLTGEVTHGDPSMPAIESIDAEVEREIWSQPRPQELQIELDSNKTQQILSAMASFTLPNMAVPSWADGVPEERWKEELLERIRQRKPNDNDEMQIDKETK